MKCSHASRRLPSHRGRVHRAFTLFEIALVVLIIGIAAGAVLTAVGGDLRSARLATAANILAADIEFTQEECINNPTSPLTIVFDLTNNQYSVQSGGTPVNHPADSMRFINDFSTGRNAQLSGVSLTGLVSGSATLNSLSFSPYGRPTNASTSQPLSADFVVTLSYRGNTMHVTVKQDTGDVSVQ